VKRGQGTIRVALAFAALLASLALVVSRQSHALEALRELDAVRSAHAVAESERSALVTRIQRLESRGRVLDVAADRLGLRVPAAGVEIVILLRDGEEAPAASSAARIAVERARPAEVVVVLPSPAGAAPVAGVPEPAPRLISKPAKASLVTTAGPGGGR